MKNNKGFVFIETMVTIVILATALLSLYTLFNNMLIKEKRRVYYDDPTYIYRSYYLFEVFKEKVKSASMSPDNVDGYINFEELLYTSDGLANVRSFSCKSDIFKPVKDSSMTTDEYNALVTEELDACNDFFAKNHIYRIYLSKYDLSYKNGCKEDSTSSACESYYMLEPQARQYVNSLPYVPGTNGYYVIFEYNEDGKGNVCQEDDCMHKFASVRFDGSGKITDI